MSEEPKLRNLKEDSIASYIEFKEYCKSLNIAPETIITFINSNKDIIISTSLKLLPKIFELSSKQTDLFAHSAKKIIQTNKVLTVFKTLSIIFSLIELAQSLINNQKEKKDTKLDYTAVFNILFSTVLTLSPTPVSIGIPIIFLAIKNKLQKIRLKKNLKDFKQYLPK